MKNLVDNYKDFLGEEFNLYTADRKLNPSTLHAYLSDIRIFQDAMGIKDSSPANVLTAIKKNDVRGYMACGKAPPRTQTRRHSSLSRFLMYCIMEEIIDSNPAGGIKPLKIECTDSSFITDKEFHALMESEPVNPNDKCSVFSHSKDLSIMSLLFLDGLGIGEILEKTYDEIAKIKVKEFTGKKMGAYHKAFFNAFGKHLFREPDEKFYRNKFNKPISKRSVRRNFSRMGKHVLGRDDINSRTIHNGYLKIQIDGILAENSEISSYTVAEKIGTNALTVRSLIN